MMVRCDDFSGYTIQLICCILITARAQFLGELGTIIGGSLFIIGFIIYYIEQKKREAFSKRIYID
jgi:hypothetical protein